MRITTAALMAIALALPTLGSPFPTAEPVVAGRDSSKELGKRSEELENADARFTPWGKRAEGELENADARFAPWGKRAEGELENADARFAPWGKRAEEEVEDADARFIPRGKRSQGTEHAEAAFEA